jgi:hypothetical protein
MHAPASRHSRAVAANSCALVGRAGWSRFVLRAPFGATAIINGGSIRRFSISFWDKACAVTVHYFS